MTTKTETRSDKLRAAHDKLEDAVAEIVSGDDWKRMLKISSKFHRYSFNNHLMIFLQRPDATHVAGFHKWKSLGRTVRKGEKGIAILAPVVYRKGKVNVSTSDVAVEVAAPDGDRPKTEILRGFRIVHVFDISQTEGEDLDLDLVRPQLLGGEAPEGLWDALVAKATAIGFEVIRHQRGSENGYCDFSINEIAVRPDVAPAQAVKTLIHELGHALLHSEELPRSKEIAEIEVESVAYVVCDALGLDSGDYSFAYVAGWSDGDTETIRDTGERVISCARSIIGGLEG